MNNVIKRVWNQGIMANIEDLQGMAFQAESEGHTFQISGIDGDGNPVALSGTPAGVMLRADGQDVTLTCSVSGGVVSATLPANAYSVPGRFGLTIFLTSDGQKTAIYAAVGTVGKTSSGTVAPPAGSDVVDLVNAIATAVATIPASYTDLMAAMAPTYSSSGLYAVGSYAWYNGKLYRCTTAITSGETWTSGHWTLANLGSDLVDLKSAFVYDEENAFGYYLYPDGSNDFADSLAFYKLIKEMYVEGDASVFEGYRISVAINTSSYQHRIKIQNENGNSITMSYSGTTKLNSATIGTSTLYIKVDWDNARTTSEYISTITYSSMLIRIGDISNSLAGDIRKKFSEFNSRVLLIESNVTNLTNDVSDLQVEVDVLGLYVEKTGNPYTESSDYKGIISSNDEVEPTSNNAFHIHTFSVEKDHVYVLFGESVSVHYDSYGLAVFSTSNYDGTNTITDTTPIIASGSTATPKNYNVPFTAPNNGYIHIGSYTDEGTLYIYDGANKSDLVDDELEPLQTELEELSDYLELGYNPYQDSETQLAQYYALITDGDQIEATANHSWIVHKFQATEGQHYKIIGNSVKLNYDSYGLASFSTQNFDGTTTIQNATPIIPAGDSATVKNYSVDFIAPTNGYIYIGEYVTLGLLSVYKTGYSSALIDRLTNTQEKTITIQAFGDSITDDSWRSDHTTWLTLLPEYLTQRTLDITNSAVGGSHMGHGKVPNGKYSELDYNYVYDLITNEDVFEPDSDIIIISAGTNDYNSGRLGTWGEKTPTVEVGGETVDSFYGALWAICDYVTRNTHALLMFCTPIARPYYADEGKPVNADGEPLRGGATLRDYADAIIRTANFFQVPVIDNFYALGWNRYNSPYYMESQDSIHPGPEGARFMCEFMSSIIKEHLGI